RCAAGHASSGERYRSRVVSEASSTYLLENWLRLILHLLSGVGRASEYGIAGADYGATRRAFRPCAAALIVRGFSVRPHPREPDAHRSASNRERALPGNRPARPHPERERWDAVAHR